MATEPEPVSSDLSTALEQVEKESIENVKTIEKKPIADDGSPPGLDVNSSGPEETADDGDVVSDKESWNNDHVAEVDKGDVSGGSDGDGIKNEAVNKDMEKPKEETNKSEVAESEAEVNKAKTEKIEVPEPSESLDAAVVKEEDVQVEDSLEKIEVPESVHEVSNVEFEQLGPEVTEIIDVGKNEDLSEEKAARVIEELEKESSEPKAGDKIEVDAAKDKESQTEPDPIGIEKPEELAHVEQRDRDFPPESEIDTESNRTEKVAMDEDNEVKKEDTVVNAKGISDFAETEQTSREIELPADLEGKTLSTVDKDIEVEKKVDAEEPHKSETRTGGVEVAKKIDVEPVATEEAEAEQNATEVAEEEKGFKEETNETELPESGIEVVNEAKGGEVAAKQNLEEIEPSSESPVVDDVAKESSQKIEILESVPEASSNVEEPEQSEAAVMITEAKDLGNSAAKQVNNEDDLSNEKDETTKESAETDVADKFEIDATKDKESQANNKVEGFELKSESVVPEPPIATDESNVEEPPENIDDTEKLAMASRDIEVPTDIIEAKNDKDNIEVDKKINAEESLESETTETKREHLSDENAGITKESKELVETESTEKFDIDAAKDEQKEVEENVKLDAPIEESDDVKSTEEEAPPKEEEVAPAVKQKQSNNLLSKVKQSLVKAKKAIIKKAPSKTPPTS